MICPSCGKEIHNDTKFCGYCGGNIISTLLNGLPITNESLAQRGMEYLAEGYTAYASVLFAQVLANAPSDKTAILGMLLIETGGRRIEDLGNVSASFANSNYFKLYLEYADDSEKDVIIALLQQTEAKIEENQRQSIYSDALKLETQGDYENAYSRFEYLDSFQDAKQHAERCLLMIQARKEEEERRKAELQREQAQKELERKQRNKKIKRAALIIIPIIIVGIAFSVVFKNVIVPKMKYEKADSLHNDGQPYEAAVILDELGDYKDSKKLAAEYFFEADSYERASALYYELNNMEQYNACIYLLAVNAFERGDTSTSYRYFYDLPNGYKDSQTYIFLLGLEPIKKANIGDFVEFGTYEQDDDMTTNNEKIEWRVVNKSGTKVLLYSRYILYYQQFNSDSVTTDQGAYTRSESYVPWTRSLLRTWLNNTFYRDAFSDNEKKLITETENLTEDENNTFKTKDKVFIFSSTEFYDFSRALGVDDFSATEYARSVRKSLDCWNGVYTRNQRRFTGLFGLSDVYSPGEIERGSVYYFQSSSEYGAIVPCIVIDLAESEKMLSKSGEVSSIDENETATETQPETTTREEIPSTTLPEVTEADILNSLPPELEQYSDGLVYEGKTYRISLQESDWNINYRSEPEFISIDNVNNNILGKMKHGTEIFVEYIYNGTWAVFNKDGRYVFSSIYSSNDPSKDRLMEVVS